VLETPDLNINGKIYILINYVITEFFYYKENLKNRLLKGGFNKK